MGKYIKRSLKNAFSFGGRCNLREYYIASTLYTVIGASTVISAYMLIKIEFLKKGTALYDAALWVLIIVLVLYTVANWALSVRRAHDLGYGIADIMFVPRSFKYLTKPGDPGPNAYGNPPDWEINPHLHANSLKEPEFPEIWDGKYR